MRITNEIHAIRIPFQIPVGPEQIIDRFVYSYLILGDEICLIDTGVSSSDVGTGGGGLTPTTMEVTVATGRQTFRDDVDCPRTNDMVPGRGCTGQCSNRQCHRLSFHHLCKNITT